MADIKNKFTVGSGTETYSSNEVTIKVVGIKPKLKKYSSVPAGGDVPVGGDISFTCEIKNPSSSTPILNYPFSDMLDVQLSYIVGTFKVNGTITVPTIVGNEIKYTIPTIAALATITITFDATVV